MRVALDTTALYTTQAGVARYIRGLLRGLAQAQPNDVDCFELVWPVENFNYQQPQRALKTAYRELLWANFIAPRELKTSRADLLHSPVACLVPPPKGMPHVLSIMDLAFLLHPERFRPWQRLAWKRYLKRVPSVDQILCISRFTADEVIRILGVPARKLHVTYLASDFEGQSPASAERAPAFEAPSEFFLFVGSLEPGKNLALLKRAYLLAAQNGTMLPPLIIVGARWEGVGHEGKPPQGWHYCGRLADAELIYLYRRAIALLFPSKYEGFGLPVLEAMSLGCPVICSPVASLPEVGGDAVYYQPLEPEAYLKAMQRLSADQTFREELISRGQAQAQKFSWKRCAEETVEVYRMAMHP